MISRDNVRWVIYLVLVLLGSAVLYLAHSVTPAPGAVFEPESALRTVGILIILLSGYLISDQFRR
ncbi:MAG: hypothetical protein KKG33_11295 [candidate division Zixibacteria bacterium]|nr:hypothetical protein [candidate division Zixibacteria bacterium]MBU2626133.1 hypothetical protein [candidate division Zixibacteria bacterium]